MLGFYASSDVSTSQPCTEEAVTRWFSPCDCCSAAVLQFWVRPGRAAATCGWQGWGRPGAGMTLQGGSLDVDTAAVLQSTLGTETKPLCVWNACY